MALGWAVESGCGFGGRWEGPVERTCCNLKSSLFLSPLSHGQDILVQITVSEMHRKCIHCGYNF